MTAAPQARAAVRPEVRPQPQAVDRKPTYAEAVLLYERGLQALQRHDFAAAATQLRTVIERFPDERELLERARLYLKVCQRELEPRDGQPQTPDEHVYAATVALNAGDEQRALAHLDRALNDNPRHDHAHYMLAVTYVRLNDEPAALRHLSQAVSMNPENRALARQDPDLEALRSSGGFRPALETRAAASVPVRGADARRPKTRK